jgi:hypothetical protein
MNSASAGRLIVMCFEPSNVLRSVPPFRILSSQSVSLGSHEFVRFIIAEGPGGLSIIDLAEGARHRVETDLFTAQVFLANGLKDGFAWPCAAL